MRGYIVHCTSRNELRVVEWIYAHAAEHGLVHLFDEVIVAMKAGKVTHPGYVLIHCEMTEELERFLRAAPHVTGILGDKGPAAVPDAAVGQICGDLWVGSERKWAISHRRMRVPTAASVEPQASRVEKADGSAMQLIHHGLRALGARSAEPRADRVEKRWYVVLVSTFGQGGVAQSLPSIAKGCGLADLIDQVVSLDPDGWARRDRGVPSAPTSYPGHVLVRCALTNAVRELIKSTLHVSGFLGGEPPIAISDADAESYIREVYGWDGLSKLKAGATSAGGVSDAADAAQTTPSW